MRVLLVEDEEKIASAVKRGLELKGYAVDTVADGDTGLSYAIDPDYDIIILDRMLPGSKDGLEIARAARAEGQQAPILILTARGSIDDRVEGLNSGADDYLVKPFSFSELVARMQALMRRPPVQTGTVLKYADLTLDPAHYEVKRAGKSIKLSSKEFALLEYFMRHAEQILTKDMIINHVWNEDAIVMPNTVEVYIGYLRAKIDRPFNDKTPLINTVRGFGYKLSR
ncbi:response regulator transcription factor [Patescibacteria group bacterium]|nr:response regulator transcription factor [Patescibacteria group bacterium]